MPEISDDWVPTLEPLLKLMDKYSLHELELARNGTTIRLKKKADTPREIVHVPAGGYMPAPGLATAAGKAAEANAGAAAAKAGLLEIKSPMVGTVYLQQSPESAPFVSVGDSIQADSTVCLIEAMKVFNEIPSGMEGEIAEILVHNGEPVEYGQPLFLVKPSRA